MQNLLFKISLIFAGMGYNMRRMIILSVIIFETITSCKELYDPKIDIIETPLVIDGLITDQANPYSIKLTKALPFNNNNVSEYATEYTGVSKAKVTVSDDCGHTYHFTEIDTGGVYMSDPAEFIGVPGRSYMLSIKTIDNKEYRSAPQLLLPNNFNVKVSAEFGTRDQLVKDGSGAYNKETVQGTNIFFDIENNEDTTIRFRFEQKIYKEYVEIPLGIVICWGIVQQKDLINITDSLTSNKNIEKHIVCFLPNIKPEVWVEKGIDYSRVVTALIPKITQFRLNPETYQFYKNCNTLLAANGKIFDPMAFQVNGNMKCISDNTVEVLGFFEASSARISYYALYNGSKIIHYRNGYAPYDSGCIGMPAPDWWF